MRFHNPGKGLRTRCLAALAGVGLWMTPLCGWSEEADLAKFRELFTELEQADTLGSVLNRENWPADDHLRSYLELELLFHPRYQVTFARLWDFFRRWPDHPHMDRVAKVMTPKILKEGSQEVFMAWFKVREMPEEDIRSRYLKGLIQANRRQEAVPLLKQMYRLGDESLGSAFNWLGSAAPTLVREDHEVRARALVDKGNWKEFLEVTAQLPESFRSYLRALDAAKRADKSFEERFQDLTEEDKRSPELWKERIDGLRRKGLRERATILLTGAEGKFLNQADRLMLRFRIGRDLVEERSFERGLTLLKANIEEAGGKLDESAWLAGWSSLKLGRRQDALEILSRLGADGQNPLLRSQGAYWASRILRVEGRDPLPMLNLAAQLPDTFYGQLAMEERDGQPPSLSGSTALPCRSLEGIPGLESGLRRLERLQAVRRSFYNREEIPWLAKRHNLTVIDQLCLTERYGAPDQAIRLAEPRRKEGEILWRGLYPIPPWTPIGGWTLDPPLVWGVGRQESLFFHRVESSAGARGILQLMPATALEESRILGMSAANKHRLQFPSYNMALGQSYLKRQLGVVKGDLVQALVSYNAGPRRAKQWEETRRTTDPILYIEEIPIAETREYVKRVIRGFVFYRMMLGKPISIRNLIAPGKPGVEALLASDSYRFDFQPTK
ncbi:MAG: lytic transglycosylase domain-containing protein [Magnetococcales bacterium]|nr:lytic transglycosylase domain-containing protein [Magnetococcales bacterium]